jgi:hypothetical protein
MITSSLNTRHMTHLPCLHIGMPKTGTKTLQMCLFSRHSQIDYLGTYIGTPRTRPRQCRDRKVLMMMNELIWDRFETPDLDRARELYEQEVVPSQTRGKIPVWSWESLMENRPEVQRKRAENLKTAFGTCRIIATIRHPVKLIESLYLQLLRRDNIGAHARLGKPPRFETIDQWATTNWHRVGDAPKSQLEYAQAIEIFADVFGADNVGVFLFEQLVQHPREYYSGICEFIGISPDEGVRLCEGQRENQRWTGRQVERLRVIESSPWFATLFRFSPSPMRRWMLRDRQGGDISLQRESKQRAPAGMTDDLTQQICEKTRSGNRRLMERWNLPLDEFQYPV